MAKDPKPGNGRPSGGASRGGSGSGRPSGQRAGGQRSGGPGGGGQGGGNRGRTRPPANVVTQQRPWGLIAGAMAVVVFAAAVIVYAVAQVNHANADKVTSIDQIADIKSYTYAAGQQHVTTDVDYTESPPVGGPHDPYWADCTGTVYSVDIRHENAVHSLEHGATWITYNPDTISSKDLATLQKLIQGRTYTLMSPYAGLTSPISLQSWNHQLFVDSASDKRVAQFVDFMTRNDTVTGHYPEIGASCDQPDFITNPVIEGQPSEAVGNTDAPTTPTAGTDATSTPAPATSSTTAP